MSSERPRLGVVLLDTAFPRRVGDIGNPATFNVPVVYRRVPGASVRAVVTADEIPVELGGRIAAAAVELVREGVDLIATSCGFLGAMQTDLQNACGVPVVSSSLCLLPLLRTFYGPERPLGVLTFDARVLRREHFGPWFEQNLVIEGLEHGTEFHRVISGNLQELDASAANADAVAAGRSLVEWVPEAAALVLECTNLSPYREQISAAVERPVYDINSAIQWFLGGLPPA